MAAKLAAIDEVWQQNWLVVGRGVVVELAAVGRGVVAELAAVGRMQNCGSETGSCWKDAKVWKRNWLLLEEVW